MGMLRANNLQMQHPIHGCIHREVFLARHNRVSSGRQHIPTNAFAWLALNSQLCAPFNGISDGSVTSAAAKITLHCVIKIPFLILA